MEFSVNPARVHNAACSIGNVKNRINSCKFRIESVVFSGISCGSAGANATIKNELRKASTEAGRLVEKAGSMSRQLDSIATAYQTTEKSITGYRQHAGLNLGLLQKPKSFQDYFQEKWGHNVFPPIGIIAGGLIVSDTSWITSGTIGTGVHKDFWSKLKDGDLKGSVVKGSVEKNGQIHGINSSGSAEGGLLNGSLSAKSGAEWNAKEGKIGASAKIEGKGTLAEGKVSGNIGYLGGSIKGEVGTVAVSGGIGLTLANQGRFAPGLEAKAEAKATALHGEAETHFGTDDNNVHVKADGSLGVAKAEAEAHAGYYTYKDEITGEAKTGFGVGASAGAEAYLAEGSVGGGINIFGIKIDASLSGKAGGAGAKVGGQVGTEAMEGEVGLGLGLGLGLKVKVDWSNFKWPWE